MKLGRSRIGAALAVAAAFSMSAAPTMARGWGDGWGGGWGHHHRDRIDAGDVIAGVVILGTIAAIASAASSASKSSRSRDDRSDRDYRDYRSDRGYDDRNYDSRPYDSRQSGSGAIGNAIDTCAAEVERGDRRVGSVDAVNRDGDGWRIQGRVGSAPFDCSVSDSGRIRSVTVDGRAAD